MANSGALRHGAGGRNFMSWGEWLRMCEVGRWSVECDRVCYSDTCLNEVAFTAASSHQDL